MNPVKNKSYTFHKYADLYPLATEEELQRLTTDITENGLANPIVLYDGKILDGRNRFICCQRAKVEPHFQEIFDIPGVEDGIRYLPEDTCDENGECTEEQNDKLALHWVISQNSHRRHLSQDQLKMVVARVAESFKELANQRKLAGLKKGTTRPDPVTATVAATGTAIKQAIQATGFKGSERSIADAVKVQKESCALAAKVSSGEISVNKAKKQLPKVSKD
jgi:hypothetical protein